MNAFYEAMGRLGAALPAVAITVLEGEHAGEKALVSGGRPVYLSEPEGFFKGKELAFIRGDGVGTLSGAAVYAERIGGTERLIVCGCGHVSMPVIRLGKLLGFRVTAIDDRESFAGQAREAGADEVICAPFQEAAEGLEGDSDSYFVIVTRGHRRDTECLREICKKPHAYIGMMGSERRAAMVRQELLDVGIAREAIDAIHTPIGLKIAAETPAEIAVSIMAEIILLKNSRGSCVLPPDIRRALEENGGGGRERRRMAMATIIRRRGSAPRQTGAKMLIFEDGSGVNTIGGGRMEAEVLRRGRQMLERKAGAPEILHLSLTADEAALEGEVCGGELDIFLEEVT